MALINNHLLPSRLIWCGHKDFGFFCVVFFHGYNWINSYFYIFDIIDKIIINYSKKEEKDGCSFLWQGFHGNVDVVTFSIFKDKQVQQVALGDDHCLFLTKDGGVYACGQNNYGQLGIGSLETKDAYDPVLINSLTGN